MQEPAHDYSWQRMLVGENYPVIDSRTFFQLRKEGHELLAVPRRSDTLSSFLALYLPQTPKARCAKVLFSVMLRSPLAHLLPSYTLTLRRTPLAQFMAVLGGGRLPEFAVVAGNPAESGRRFVLGLAASAGKVSIAVKCGDQKEARQLIVRESCVLKQLAPSFPYIPRCLSSFDSPEAAAFATDFFPELTRPLDRAARVALVSKWITTAKEVDLRHFPEWTFPPDAAFGKRGLRVNPVVFHGDFAPWNLRSMNGLPMVIDWERGCVEGPPLWDLLHYEIHEEILVKRSRTEQVRERIHELLKDPSIQTYLANCNASQHSDLLLQGYLSHLDTIYPQIRGRRTVDELIASYRS
jgi:hypothetical protein